MWEGRETTPSATPDGKTVWVSNFGDGTVQRLEEGSFARVDAPTMRKLRNVGEGDAVYLCVGGKDGYVGRDGRAPEGDPGPRATRIDGSGGD